jgi:hypothetical protein
MLDKIIYNNENSIPEKCRIRYTGYLVFCHTEIGRKNKKITIPDDLEKCREKWSLLSDIEKLRFCKRAEFLNVLNEFEYS